MNNLPGEIVQIILSYLDQRTLAHINATSKTLHHASLHRLYESPTFNTISQFQLFVTNLNNKAADCLKVIDLSPTNHRWKPETNGLVDELVQKAKRIVDLNLCLCQIGFDVLVSCVQNLDLRYLSLNENRCVDDKIMIQLLPRLASLRGLDIGATNIRDRTLKHIAKYCKQLESLDVSDCQRITEDGVRCLTTELPRLNFLNLANCYNVVSMDGEFDGVAVDEGEWEDEDEQSA
ncbi:hypothetical protein BJV82DRAFT_598187 [Fennellomyces sp. T-0311]|nr:hypothetical protein BJV82DRAFT_598187 [Fennellomyces sp. T-0311]